MHLNPHAAPSTSLLGMARSFWASRHLIQQLIKREIVGRYKGSLLGVGWSFFNPLMMLTVYTFVFSVVFKARWGVNAQGTRGEFALILFVGLLIHSLFSEVLVRSPSLLIANTNYIKKVVFPLEILTLVSLCSAFFHALISLGVLLVMFIVLNGMPYWTILYTPFTLLPLLPLTLGVGWFLTSLGVYLRDIGQVMGILTSLLLFLAPVFYPIIAIPEQYRIFLYLNPLTLPIEETRGVILFGHTPHWDSLALYTAISVLICSMGFWWFQKARHGFSNVV